MKKIIPMLMSLCALTSCGLEIDHKELSPKTKGRATEALTSNRWCSAGKLQDGTIEIRRYQMTDEYMKLSHLLIDKDQNMTVFKTTNERINWQREGDRDFFYSATVKFVKGSANVGKMKNLEKQKDLAKDLGTHQFNPTRALEVTINNLFGHDTTEAFYPCPSYDKSFESNENARNDFEFAYRKALSRNAFRESGMKEYHALKTPLPYIQARPESLKGSQWCGWTMVYDSVLYLNVLTLTRKNTIRFNSYSTDQSWDMSDAEFEKFLKTQSKDSVKYQASYSGSAVKASRTYQRTKESRNFRTAKDATGRRVIYVGDAYDSYITPKDILFPCTDRTPLKGDARFARRFDQILQLERRP